MNKYRVYYYEYNQLQGSNKLYPYGRKVAETMTVEAVSTIDAINSVLDYYRDMKTKVVDIAEVDCLAMKD